MKYLRKFNESSDLKEKTIGNTKVSSYYNFSTNYKKGFTELENDLSELFFIKDKIKYKFDINDNSLTSKYKSLTFLVITEDEKHTEFTISKDEFTNIVTLYDLYDVMKNKLEKSTFLSIYQVYFRGKITSIDDPIMKDMKPEEKYWEEMKFKESSTSKRISDEIINTIDILSNYNKPFDINVFQCFDKINNMSQEEIEEFYLSTSSNRKESNSDEENFIMDLIDKFDLREGSKESSKLSIGDN